MCAKRHRVFVQTRNCLKSKDISHTSHSSHESTNQGSSKYPIFLSKLKYLLYTFFYCFCVQDCREIRGERFSPLNNILVVNNASREDRGIYFCITTLIHAEKSYKAQTSISVNVCKFSHLTSLLVWDTTYFLSFFFLKINRLSNLSLSSCGKGMQSLVV